jgi:hypothetical protein
MEITMKNTVLRTRLSALALAGLATGLAAGPLHAGDCDSTKTEKKGCKGKTCCKGMAHDSAMAKEDRSCSGTGHCGGTDSAAGACVDSTSPMGKMMAAKSEKEFAKAAKAAGMKVEKTSCATKNSCKGVYFSAGKTTELSCKGTASCHGLKATM